MANDSLTGTSGTPLTFSINFVLVPIVYFIGFFGNSICLYVLVKQVKKNFGYSYQIVIVLNDLLGTLFSTFFRFGRVWYGLAYNSGPGSLRANVLIMTYTAYLAVPMTTVCHFVALSMTLCISVDRTLAFYKPFYYKIINKKRQFLICLIVALVFSVLVNTFDFAAYILTYNSRDNVYYVEINLSIVKDNFGYLFLTYFRTVARFLLILTIFILNLMIIVKYRAMKKHPVKLSVGKSTDESITENVLALFLLLHSFVLGLGQLPLAIACVPINLNPTWTVDTWEGRITADVINTLGAVQWAAGFLFYLGLSREFRKTVFRSFGIKRQSSTSGVTMLTMQTTRTLR